MLVNTILNDKIIVSFSAMDTMENSNLVVDFIEA